MIDRPPQPQDFFNVRESSPSDLEAYAENYHEMQEALTAEWLIEQGLLPDPSEFIWNVIGSNRTNQVAYYLGGNFALTSTSEWTCKDKTQ